MKLIFDRICVELMEGRECFSPEVFINKPVHVRVQYVLERRVSFWLNGAPVDSKAALNNYRQWSVSQLAMMPSRI